MISVIDLARCLEQIQGHWQPHIVGELNGQQVKLAKIQGAFDWHHHEHEDELFLVLKGRMCMELKDRTLEAEEGQVIIVPRGVEHRPSADEECHILLFEPIGTRNTGNLQNERTVEAKSFKPAGPWGQHET